jgi:Ni/Co efflux regulator RcnB
MGGSKSKLGREICKDLKERSSIKDFSKEELNQMCNKYRHEFESGEYNRIEQGDVFESSPTPDYYVWRTKGYIIKDYESAKLSSPSNVTRISFTVCFFSVRDQCIL